MKIIRYLNIYDGETVKEKLQRNESFVLLKEKSTHPCATIEINVVDVETKYLFERQGNELPEKEAVNA